MKRFTSPAFVAGFLAIVAIATVAVLVFNASLALASVDGHVMFAMAAGAGLDLDELSTEVKAAIGDLTKTTSEALAKLAADLTAEKKHVDELEKKLNRANLGGGNETAGNLKAETKALSNWLRNDKEGGAELKAMSVGSDPGGGYTVLPAFSSQMLKKLFDQSAVRRLARVVTISTGEWEEIIDANDVEAQWTGEKSPRTATATADIGKLKIEANEIYANQPITQNLIDDSVFDVGAWAVDKVNDKFGRTEGDAFVNGNGVGKPNGFLSYPIVITSDATRPQGQIQYFKTGAAAAFATTTPGDVLIDMVYGLRAPYKQGSNVAWLMNSNTAGTVRKFKDGQGNYLWSDALVKGQPPMLLGYPVELDESMPNIGANNYPIAFANWQLAYIIVDRQGLKLLTDPYTNKPFVMFYTTKRVGGGLGNSEAIKLLKCEL